MNGVTFTRRWGRRAVLAFALMALCPGAGRATVEPPPPVPAGQTVLSVKLVNDSRVSGQEIRRLFALMPGDAYDPAAVRRSLRRMSRLSGVANVEVRGDQRSDGVELQLVVNPQPLVRKVKFERMRQLKKDEVALLLRTREDDEVYRPFLKADIAEIRRLYANHGYVHAQVDTRIELVREGRWAEVVFVVEENEPEPVAALGDMGESDRLGLERVVVLTGMEVGGPASSHQLREGVKKLLTFCRDAEYPEANAQNARLEKTARGQVLHIPLTLGPRTRVVIEGVEWGISDLLDIVRSRYGEPINQEWVKQVSLLLEDALREQGFATVEVHGHIDEPEHLQIGGNGEEPEAQGTMEMPEPGMEPVIRQVGGESFRRVHFEVKRGKKIRVKKVRFRGNENISSDELRDYMGVLTGGWLGPGPYRRKQLDSDVDSVRRLYRSRGFITAQAEVREIDILPDGKAHVFVEVKEGPRYTFDTLTFEADGVMDDEQVRRIAAIRTGEPANHASLDAARVRLLAEYSKMGYIEASIDVDVDVDNEARTVDVRFVMRSGGQFRFGTILVSGNARTNAEVLLRELTFRTGQVWDAQEVLLSQRNIFRLGFFQQVRIEPAGEPDALGEVDVVVRVREQDAGFIGYGFGYATQIGFKAFGEIGHNNLYGSGRSVSLRGEIEGDDYSIALNFKEPWIFGYPYDLRLSLIHQFETRDAYDLTATAFQAALDKEFTEKMRGSLLYTLEINDLSDVVEGATIEDEDEEYLLSGFGPLLIWDSRDDPFNPREGFHHNLTAQWAVSEIGSEVEFGKYWGFISGFTSVDRYTLALLGRAGYADLWRDTVELPVNKRFFLGGSTTVRGFDRDEVGPKADDGTPIGGDAMLNLKAEARVKLYKKWGGVVFWDAGQVWIQSQSSPQIDDLRHAAGVGIRWNTPVGPLSLDYGRALDRKTGEPVYVIHFIVGNAF